MNLRFRHAAAVLLAGVVMATGCTSPPPPPGYADDGVSYWNGDQMSGSPFVHIKLGEQKAYFYKGGQLAGVSRISSGREGLGTKTGNFHIRHKELHHKSTLFGNYVDAEGRVIQKEVDTRKDPKPPGARFDGADMPYWMPIVGGIGMHQGFLPGYPASHGCIRLPAAMAKAFYHSVSVGTPVKIEH